MSEPPQAEVVVKAADMPEDMQELFIDICRDAISDYTIESDIAAYIKKTVDTRDSPTWHCIVGISFGSYVAHSRNHFLHLKIKAPKVRGFEDLSVRRSENSGWCYVLLFKTQ